jgi:hypothetical protein
MRFLPLTRQVELESANPERIISAFPGTYFYREGNDRFYLIRNNIHQRIDVKKRSFTLDYQNEIWFPTIQNDSIVFSEPYELWVKKGEGNNAAGWSFVSNNKLRITEIPIPTPTPYVTPPTPTPTPVPSSTPTATPVPSSTPTNTPTPTPVPSSTPTNTPTATPSPTPTEVGSDASDDFEEYSLGDITLLSSGSGIWRGDGVITASFYPTGSDNFESYSVGTITTLTSGSGIWRGSGSIF